MSDIMLCKDAKELKNGDTLFEITCSCGSKHRVVVKIIPEVIQFFYVDEIVQQGLEGKVL